MLFARTERTVLLGSRRYEHFDAVSVVISWVKSQGKSPPPRPSCRAPAGLYVSLEVLTNRPTKSIIMTMRTEGLSVPLMSVQVTLIRSDQETLVNGMAYIWSIKINLGFAIGSPLLQLITTVIIGACEQN